MKSLIDVSVYVIVMTIMCFISLDFILINKDVSQKQRMIDYIKDYVELYGTSVDTGVTEQGKGIIYALDSDVEDTVIEMADREGMHISITYVDSTSRYYYYNMEAVYNIRSRLLGINKVQNSRVLIRTEVEHV